jgi:16S rRNA (guanine966-N2)-methyltransferase
MRVVAGEYGGRRLAAPPARGTRPTADRVREALFSMLGDVSGLRVLDLFAGSGALGIEALSRGAASVTFVESDARAAAVIRQNLDALGAEGEVKRRDAMVFLAAQRGTFDLVLADPPYDSAPLLAASLAERLPGVLSENARIVTESDKRKPLELPFPLLRERTYRDIRIAIHER